MHIIGSQLFRYKTIDSTNNHALDLIAKNNPTEGTVISTDFQSDGKGQRGNIWQSEANANLLFSVILYPRFLKIDQQFYLSMITAIAVCNIIETYLEPKKLFIKWPNDIYVENRKLAGMLIQNNLSNKLIESSVIGVGCNINQKQFDPVLSNPTSLMMENEIEHNKDEILGQILSELDKQYDLLKKQGFNEIKKNFEKRLMNKGVISKIKTKDTTIEGIILGVVEDGRLLVNIDGRVKKLEH